MMCKKFIISASELNSGMVELDISVINNNYRYYPSSIRFFNSSNIDLGYRLLTNIEEKNFAKENPDLYNLIPIPKDPAVTFIDLPKTQYIQIEKLTGTATGSLELIAYNYLYS